MPSPLHHARADRAQARSDRMSPLGNALLAALPMLAAIFTWGVPLALIGG